MDSKDYNKEHSTEWSLLQNQYDSYEKHSLYIKLLSIAVFLAGVFFDIFSIYILFSLAILWGQDAIWKTFQSRIEKRLLAVEQAINENREEHAFQFNSEFMKERSGGVSLLKEYFHQAIRPTIAFPHAVLIVLVLAKNVI